MKKLNTKIFFVAVLSFSIALFGCQESQLSDFQVKTTTADVNAVNNSDIKPKSQFASAIKAVNNQDEEEIRRLVSERNLSGLVRVMGKIQEKPVTQNNLVLLADICSALNSYNFSDEKQYLLSRQCTKRVLENAAQIPVALELKMVEHLQGTDEYKANLLSPQEWNADRRARVRFLLHLWQRLQNGLDKDFDFNAPENQAVLNVPVPAPGYMVGISLSDVKDPEVRAKYEEARRVNGEKIAKRNLQIQLQRIEKRLPDFVENFLVQMYSIPPFNIDELREDVKLFNLSSERESRLIKTVSEVQQKSQQP